MSDWNARVMIRVAGRAVVGIVLLAFAYIAAGVIGGAIPANRHWRPPADGIEIWVEDNGIHTGIVVPKVAAGIDWRGVARPEHLRDPRFGGHPYLSFGWGERAFYLGTPTWADLRPGTVIAAALGSEATLVHLDHLPRPIEGEDVRRVVLRPEEYRRLAAALAASFRPGGRRWPGYGRVDAFYEGRGRYSAVTTCNEWAGAALRRAGVRVGVWTPFSDTVMMWF